ncbi:MAG: hypothetical protein GY716_06350 [bacterium]|nr:hypothetical protein [bacterium]
MRRHWKKLALGLVAFALIAGPAAAHGGHGHKQQRKHGYVGHRDYKPHPRYSRHYSGHRQHHKRASFVVPKKLHHGGHRHYRDYHRGWVYDRRHGHRHSLYYFPVQTEWGWAKRPHYYCGDRLYTSGHVSWHGKRVSVGFGW